MTVVLACLVMLPVYIKSRSAGAVAPVPAAFAISLHHAPVVSVRGDVRYSGLYPATANSMAITVIKMAEPLCRLQSEVRQEAKPRFIDVGEQLTVSCDKGGEGHILYSFIPVAQRIILGIPLDINRISDFELDLLPGIGPSLASRIIKYRQDNGGVMAADELIRVPGIGDRKYYQLRPFFN